MLAAGRGCEEQGGADLHTGFVLFVFFVAVFVFTSLCPCSRRRRGLQPALHDKRVFQGLGVVVGSLAGELELVTVIKLDRLLV
jgi:hypothetical protein